MFPERAFQLRAWLTAGLVAVLPPVGASGQEAPYVAPGGRDVDASPEPRPSGGAYESYRYSGAARPGDPASPVAASRQTPAPRFRPPAERLGESQVRHADYQTPGIGAGPVEPAAGEAQRSAAPVISPVVDHQVDRGEDTSFAVQSPEIGEFSSPPAAESPPDYIYLPPPQTPPQRAPSPWQRLVGPAGIRPHQTRLVTTWLPGDGDEIGIADIDLEGTFVLPWLTAFTLTPGFQTHFLDGPTRTDLPGQLYNARAEFRWVRQINRQLGIELAVAPGVYSDFEHTGSDALRITGRALGFYATSAQSQWVLGIAYLDREDIAVLPAFGLIHLPSEDVRLEMVFPRPKLAMRLSRSDYHQRWAYLLGEFGGGSWAIERRAGTDDIATYSDWRFIVGVEQKYANGRSWLVEAGYVFNRELEYESGLGDFDPDDTVMLRAGTTF